MSDLQRTFEHCVLHKLDIDLPRRKVQNRGGRPQRDRIEHGSKLREQLEAMTTELGQRRTQIPDVNPKLVFKLRLSQNGDVDDDTLNRAGLKVLARDDLKVVVVFPNEITLNSLRERIDDYTHYTPGDEEHNKYDFVNAIDAIEDLRPEDRIGFRLKQQPESA